MIRSELQDVRALLEEAHADFGTSIRSSDAGELQTG